MGQLPQSPSSHVYSPSFQLKLYHPFIISLPILFTIILLLVFYLFYLKKRGLSNFSSSSHVHRRSLNEAPTALSLPLDMGLMNNQMEKLPIIIYNKDLRVRDTRCCVCLMDFEMEEKLHQIPSCKHTFHLDCIHHWLMSGTTCPLCRASILPTKMEPPIRLNIFRQSDIDSDDRQRDPWNHALVGLVDRMSWNVDNFLSGDESSSTEDSAEGQEPCLNDSGNSQGWHAPIDVGVDHSYGTSV